MFGKIATTAARLVLAGAIGALAPAVLNAEELTYRLQIDRGDIVLDRSANSTTITVSDPAFDLLSEPGAPELPYRIVSFLLPQGEVVDSYDFVASKPIEIATSADLKVAPPLVSEDGVERAGRGLAQSAAGVFPDVRGRYLSTGYLHGRTIASFAVFPLRNRNGTVEFSETVDVRVATKPAPDQNVISRERFRDGFDKKINEILGNLVVNLDMSDRYNLETVRVAKKKGGFQPTSYPSLEGSDVDYLIITTDALSAEYQRLADFKTAKGVPTVVRTTEFIEANTRRGVDLQETMRFFIQDAYAKWGISFLLLGGDTDILPVRRALTDFLLEGLELPVDLYFSGLDGAWNDDHDDRFGEGAEVIPIVSTVDNPDLLAEVYNGRIPISDLAGLSAFIDKIINYESAANPSYLDQYLYLSEVLFPSDWKIGETINLNGPVFSEFLIAVAMQSSPMVLTRMYETPLLYPGSIQESVPAAIAEMNAGYNHINHVGHGFRFNMSVGSASILNSDADALVNTGEYFNLFMLNCTAAAYDFFCLAEHYLKNPTAGAVSVIGANESAFPNAAANYMEEYHRLVFDRDVVRIGEAFARSRLLRTPIAEQDDNVDLWTHYIYTLLADPEMPLFTGPVQTLTVAHVGNVSLGDNAILVNVTSNAQPVDSAVVCLSKDDEDYQSGFTNSLGNVVINFTAESPGSISVVTTALNAARKQTWIVVDPAASAYVSSATLLIDDDAAGGTVGNGDGLIDAGETVDITIDFTNSGGAQATGVGVTISTAAPMVTISDATASVGTVNAGATVSASDPVRITVDAAIADGSVVEFALSTTDGSDTWDDTFRKVIHAPILEVIGLRFDDSVFGNGDNVMQNGEEVELFFNLKNYGTGSANGLTATIVDQGSAFTITQGASGFTNLGALTGAENTTSFRLSEANTGVENLLDLTILDSHSRSVITSHELREPDAPTTLLFNTAFGPDRLEVAWTQSTAPDVVRYNIYRSLTSGGPYTKANVDPVDHGVYLDTGLAGTTQYFYVVAAIDGSGNESAQSSESAASTNPAQMPGFPILMKGQTPSSPAVGDIDGDGDNEIVVGNERVYAWHVDGLEIRDGDGDPQTWGPINDEGDEFAASVTLAAMDQVPGLDIVAADLVGRQVFIMNFNGDVLPGWPRDAQLAGFRAAPVVGDIDADGDLEVICVDEKGVVYVWHHDGTEYRDGDSNPVTDGVFFVTAPTSVHYITPVLCDLDGDLKDEIIVGTRGGIVYAWNDDGTDVPGWPFNVPGEVKGAPVAGDIDGDNFPEIAVRSTTTEVYVLNHDGTIASGWPRFVALNSVFFAYANMALADFEGDGKLELVLNHHSGNDSRLYIINHLGADLPGWPLTVDTEDHFSESGPTVADLNNDGQLDIIYGDESRFLYAFDLSNNLIPGFPITTEDAIRAIPVIDDTDGDGDIDMVLSSWDQRMYLYDMTSAFNPNLAPWPTFQGNSHRNGKFGFTVPTGIGGASFSYQIEKGSVLGLNWILGTPDETRYTLERSLVENDVALEFVAIATGLKADAGGVLEYDDKGVAMGEKYQYRVRSESDPNDTFTTGAIYIPITIADIAQNYPNPFNPTTQIPYLVPEGKSQVTLVVYDVSGARVRTLVNGEKPGGSFVATWDGRDDTGNQVSSGVYFYRFTAGSFADTKKMVLLK